MSITRDTKEPSPCQPTSTTSAAAEYQPPAIAWEEPLEAIAASSCALIPMECSGAATA